VVGSTGRKMPRKPNARLATARARSSHNNPLGNAFGGAEAGGGCAEMPRIVPCERWCALSHCLKLPP
jgi:hypothetical protein